MKHQCSVCGYIYDDAVEKVPFDDLPDDWVCPMCGAAKSDFELLDEETEKEMQEALRKRSSVKPEVKVETPSVGGRPARHQCTVCGFIYDDAVEKVPFDDLPDDWVCPMCGAAKSDFVLMDDEPAAPPRKTPEAESEDLDDMDGLTVAQMSALCSNLARGCEKQYRFDDMRSFQELADYFASVTPAVRDGKVEDVASRIMSDVEEYPRAVDVCSQEADRGAWRVCVWGEKVTRMLNSLVKRYLVEGEAMLENTQIWVCTVCGFVYVGDKPPEKCPVCGVPSWKFQKMEGRA